MNNKALLERLRGRLNVAKSRADQEAYEAHRRAWYTHDVWEEQRKLIGELIGILSEIEAELAAPDLEPVSLQFRSKAPDADHWFDWRDCDKIRFDDFVSYPIRGGWHYEVRKLHTSPPIAPKAAPAVEPHDPFANVMPPTGVYNVGQPDVLAVEPVAWRFYTPSLGGYVGPHFSERRPSIVGTAMHAPLYDHPQPALKPLSHIEVQAVMDDLTDIDGGDFKEVQIKPLSDEDRWKLWLNRSLHLEGVYQDDIEFQILNYARAIEAAILAKAGEK